MRKGRYGIFINDLKMAIFNLRFVVAVVLFVILYLISSDWQTVCGWKSECGIWEALEYVKMMGICTWFTVMVLVLPYGASVYEEIQSKSILQVFYRAGRRRYYISKGFAVFLTGGLVAAIGLILYICILYFGLGMPLDVLYGNTGSDDFVTNALVQGNFMLYYGENVFLHFLFGGTIAVFGMLISVYLPNRFLIVISPYIVVYVINILPIYIPYLLKLEYNWGGYIHCDSVLEGFVNAISYFGILTLVEMLLFVRGVERRMSSI